MGPERAPQLESPEEVERRVQESAEVIARSARLGAELDDLLHRARRLLIEQRALVRKFRRESRRRRG